MALMALMILMTWLWQSVLLTLIVNNRDGKDNADGVNSAHGVDSLYGVEGIDTNGKYGGGKKAC